MESILINNIGKCNIFLLTITYEGERVHVISSSDNQLLFFPVLIFQNPVTYTSFDCLSVPIPASVFGTISLEYLLEKFTQMELVHDVECAECSKRLSVEISSPNGTIEHSSSSSTNGSTETVVTAGAATNSSSPKCHRVFRKQMTIGKVRE